MTRQCAALIGLGLIVLTGVSGCASLTQSAKDRKQQNRHVMRHDWLAMQEDIDLLLLNERTTRLTRWHDR